MDYCNLSAIFLFVFARIATGLDESALAQILKFEYFQDTPTSYFYQYETSDGQKKEEKGEYADSSEFVVRGSYAFLGADGITYEVHYVADKDGFHPSGDHINVPPYTPWPVNRFISEHEDEAHYRPRANYLPSSEKPPTIEVTNDLADSFITNRHEVPSTTPQPPLRGVTNTYIPSSPAVVILNHNHQGSSSSTSTGVEVDRNPFRGYSSNILSNAYIPSTPSPAINSVTVTPHNYIGAASTQVPTQVNGKNGRGRGKNLEADKKATSDLVEVIQNNHSSHGVFKYD